MVRWGGKHSVPLLIKLLEEPLLNNEVFRALGSLKDSRAAVPVAMRLTDRRDREAAYLCLQEMGAAAEDVVIEIVPNNDPQLSMAAVNLLAEIGTDKCLPMLRKAASKSLSPEIRKRAKSAIVRVRKRESEKDS